MIQGILEGRFFGVALVHEGNESILALGEERLGHDDLFELGWHWFSMACDKDSQRIKWRETHDVVKERVDKEKVKRK